MGRNSGAVALFPEEINVKKCKYQSGSSSIVYFTNDVIKIPKSIKMLNSLEDGHVDYIAENIHELEGQLECFEFSQKPIDSVKLATIRDMYGW